MRISESEILNIRYILDAMPKEIRKNWKKYFKETRREINSTAKHLSNHHKIEKTWFQKSTESGNETLFSSNRKVRFILGRVSGLNPSKPTDSIPAIKSSDTDELNSKDIEAQETESNHNIQIDEEPFEPDNLEDEEEVTFDASAFEVTVEDERQSLYQKV